MKVINRTQKIFLRYLFFSHAKNWSTLETLLVFLVPVVFFVLFENNIFTLYTYNCIVSITITSWLVKNVDIFNQPFGFTIFLIIKNTLLLYSYM